MVEGNIFTTYILPVFTVGIVNWMFCAPLKTLQEQIKVGSLGFLNPTPWVFMFGNCFAWVSYAMVMEKGFDYKITMLLANGPGLIISIYLNLCACKLQYQDYMSGKMKEEFVKFLYEHTESGSIHTGKSSSFVKAKQFSHLVPLIGNLSVKDAVAPANHEKYMVAMSSFWLIVVSCLVFIPMTAASRTYIIGIIGNLLLIFFYASPLSTIMVVLRTRSSVTIHVPTMILNTANSSFWFVYTLFQQDPWQYVPNGIGSILGFLQIFLAFIFPRAYIEEEDFSDQSEIFEDDCDFRETMDSFISKITPKDKVKLPEYSAVADTEINVIGRKIDIPPQPQPQPQLKGGKQANYHPSSLPQSSATRKMNDSNHRTKYEPIEIGHTRTSGSF